eukprot:COSAG02_NODE_9078_length_2340_cov_9.692548_3_plen_79_part_00
MRYIICKFLLVRYNTERDRKQRVSWIQQTSCREATEQAPVHPPHGSTPQAGRVTPAAGDELAGRLRWLGHPPAAGDNS